MGTKFYKRVYVDILSYAQTKHIKYLFSKCQLNKHFVKIRNFHKLGIV